MEEEPTTPLRDDSREPAASWHVGLWVAQIMLAVVFGMAGFAKVSSPIPEIQAQLDWADDVPIWLVRFIGASELLGAIGLILPAATRIKPMLTPLAAVGLGIIMILAGLFHAMRGEFPVIPLNVFLLAVAAFVAWGRLRRVVILDRWG